jgi:DNA-binding MarR family transcriptional regulator
MDTKKRSFANQVILNLVQTANSLTKIADRFFKPYNLTTAQYNVLVILKNTKIELSQYELSSRLVVSRSDITGIVDRLEKCGYIKRVPHQYDRRINLLRIMKKGKVLVEHLEEKYFQRVETIVGNLSLSDLRQLEQFINQIHNAAKQRKIKDSP